MRSVVILPTFNEKGNLGSLVDEILATDPSVDVLIVDDASPDGTGESAEELSKRSSRVFVIHRPAPRGRGLAGIDGFLWAVRRGYEAVIEMDADFSHPPRYIPEFLKAVQSADVVIGSRGVQGSEVARKSVFRNALSGAANGLIRFVLGTSVRDCTSGFRCFRGRALSQLPFDRMISTGPSIVEEILYVCIRKKFKITEIPIRFEERRSGRSKLGPVRLLETLGMLIKIRSVHAHR